MPSCPQCGAELPEQSLFCPQLRGGFLAQADRTGGGGTA